MDDPAAEVNELSWSDTKAILNEVEYLFQRDEDIRDMQDIKKMAHEIDLHCSNGVKDAKELIKR